MRRFAGETPPGGISRARVTPTRGNVRSLWLYPLLLILLLVGCAREARYGQCVVKGGANCHWLMVTPPDAAEADARP